MIAVDSRNMQEDKLYVYSLRALYVSLVGFVNRKQIRNFGGKI